MPIAPTNPEAYYLYVGRNATVTADVDGAFKVGSADGNWTGTIANYGTVRLVASAVADADIYTPMFYGTMDNSGTLQTLGGLWNEDAHSITITGASVVDRIQELIGELVRRSGNCPKLDRQKAKNLQDLRKAGHLFPNVLFRNGISTLFHLPGMPGLLFPA